MKRINTITLTKQTRREELTCSTTQQFHTEHRWMTTGDLVKTQSAI